MHQHDLNMHYTTYKQSQINSMPHHTGAPSGEAWMADSGWRGYWGVPTSQGSGGVLLQTYYHNMVQGQAQPDEQYS